MITYATEPHKTRSMIAAVLHHSHYRFSEKNRPSASGDEYQQTTSRHFTQMFGGCTPASSPLTSIPIQPKSLQISFRHRSNGPASYSTDLQYRGRVRLHVNATNVLFFLRTFQDERPLYRKLTTSAFQENYNIVWENSNNGDIKARRIPNKLPVKKACFLSICVVDRTNAPWRTIDMLLLPWRMAVL